MAQVLRTVAVLDRVIPAAGETAAIDLPVNPLSAIVITLKYLNNTAAPADYSAISAALAKFTSFNVRYRGATIFDALSDDMVVLAAGLQKWLPQTGQNNNTDNDVRALTSAICFGRRPYDPMECFPATRRGDLILQWIAGADPTGADNFLLHVETIELLDATPQRYLKTTRTARTMTLGDTNDVDLPIGNKLLGLLLKGATFPTGASRNASFSDVRLEVDNVEVMYSRSHWETLHGELGRWLNPAWGFVEHVHSVNAAAAGEEDTKQAENDFTLQQQYAYMDLDPMYDGSYALDTQGAADVTLGVVSDVADAAASSVYPIELVEIAGAAGG